jgi:hypothetical protein
VSDIQPYQDHPSQNYSFVGSENPTNFQTFKPMYTEEEDKPDTSRFPTRETPKMLKT